jgi:hypothetical protein
MKPHPDYRYIQWQENVGTKNGPRFQIAARAKGPTFLGVVEVNRSVKTCLFHPDKNPLNRHEINDVYKFMRHVITENFFQ